jgi:hypothetical protein
LAAALKEADALQRIVKALGAIRLVAKECSVSTWTARAWLAGTRQPSPANQRRLNLLAQDLKLPPPYPQWETGRRRPDGHEGANGGLEDRLRLDVSKDEEDFGFGVSEETTGVRAVVRELHPGLRAVKVGTDAGTHEYAICDDDLRPVYLPAKTLDELRTRFPGRR